jgi:hypothetical protein
MTRRPPSDWMDAGAATASPTFSGILLVLALALSTYQKWLALAPYLRPAVVTFVALAVWSCWRALRVRGAIFRPTPPQIAILIFAIYVIILDSAVVSSVNLLHPLFYIIFLVGSAIFIPPLLINRDVSRLFYIAYIVALVSFFFDFIFTNFLGFSLARYLQFIHINGFYDPFIRPLFLSPSGPAEEPGDMGFYLCVLFPFAFDYISRRRNAIALVGLVAGQLCALLFLFSAASIALFPASFLLTILVSIGASKLFRSKLFDRRDRRLTLLIFLLLFMVVMSAAIMFADASVGNSESSRMTQTFAEKLTFSERSISAMMRRQDAILMHDAFIQNPIFGQGLGYFSAAIGHVPQNIYMLFAAETGVVGLTLFSAYLFLSAWSARESFFFLWAVMYGVLHLFLISDIWNMPFLYAVAAAISLRSGQSSRAIAT